VDEILRSKTYIACPSKYCKNATLEAVFVKLCVNALLHLLEGYYAYDISRHVIILKITFKKYQRIKTKFNFCDFVFFHCVSMILHST
jgi:hypothetical protein